MDELIKLLESSDGQIRFEPFYSELTVVISRDHGQWIVGSHDYAPDKVECRLCSGDNFNEALLAASAKISKVAATS